MKKLESLLSLLLSKTTVSKFGLVSLLFLVSLWACQDDRGEGVTPQTPPNQPEQPEQPTGPDLSNFQPTQKPVTGDIFGFVVDENNQPLVGASVSLGTDQTTTDDFGHFTFSNVAMNGRGTLVKVSQSGYFTGSRRFFPVQGQESRVKIELIRKTMSGSFNTDNGGTIDLNGGASVSFSPSGIIDANGDPYTGTVQVASQWLDPTDPRTFDQMPGNLQGVNNENEEVALLTYGMMVVELEDSNNEPLNLDSASTATITMPIPAELLAGAPAEIPLWSYNEEFGIWVQEGTATLQNGNYVGEVGHFSFWNCDAPFELVEVDFRLVDENQQPLDNYKVQVVRANAKARAGYGYSDRNGVVSGLLPANETLELNVFDQCDNIVYSEIIGPFSQNTSLGDITITGSVINNTIIRGSLVGCEGTNITNAVVLVEFDGQTVYHYTDGPDFEIAVTTCSSTNEVKVTGVDLDNLIQSESFIVNPNAETDLGVIIVCGEELENFIRLTVDNETVIYPNATIFTNDSTGIGTDSTFTFIQASGNVQDFYIGFGFQGGTPGDYSDRNFIEGIFDSNRGWSFRAGEKGFESLIVREFGGSGEAVKGTFSGSFINFNNNVQDTVQVSGEFNVTRK